MATHKILHLAAALMVVVGLSACQVTTTSNVAQPQANEVPVDLVELQRIYMAANPNRTSLHLTTGGRGGFKFRTDGTVTYRPFKADHLRHNTAITERRGNRMCMAPEGSWSGACFATFRLPDGRVRVRYVFGNGRGGTFIARNIQLGG